jgi:FAD/FMN-containing dehydrogenase/Fe-S oxidoreductase
MSHSVSSEKLQTLQQQLKGELHFSHAMRSLYATDASVYRELPLAVAYPKDEQDIKTLIRFAAENNSSLIPRTAGTSLAGQCVGDGIVVDVSKYFNKVIEINKEAGWVLVQPGVVRDELNMLLKPHGLLFGPNTSTANRAMIGGMVGNNSCGSYSIVYGTTRDHVLELKTILSDGSDAFFTTVSVDEFNAKCSQQTLEGSVYRHIKDELSSPETRAEIRNHFPKPEIHRRNTGYAVDVIMNSEPFVPGSPDFNMCKLLAGSEGTLAFTTEIKLHCNPLPPPHTVLVCAHFKDIDESMNATLIAMRHQPRAVELMDKIILDCTKENIEYRKSRFFVEGDPGAILVIEFSADTKDAAIAIAHNMIAEMKQANYGYAFPLVDGGNIKKVWDLRAAGLGLLSNVKGKRKPVAVIEDTAVALPELPAYISEFTQMMKGFNQNPVYYAHAGAGELHLRPILDLKDESDRKLFREIATASARLVKKYNGSLSGEHGDGRVRAEFIPMMVGEKNYQLFRRIKQKWDPKNIFNPGKIVDAAPMDISLRYDSRQKDFQPETIFDFNDGEGMLAAAEKCNGSGDCRKSHLSGGTMCPSYMATKNEKDTTRARANLLREYLTRSTKHNRFDSKELFDVLDLCISCKGCKSECPSNVDMATLKAEFLHQYYKTHGVPFRARAIANIGKLNQLASLLPAVSNLFLEDNIIGNAMKSFLGVAEKRSLPKLHDFTLRSWFNKNRSSLQPKGNVKRKVFFFCDEFTNYNDVEAGMKAIQLLACLGYEVEIPNHVESGRAYFSKGLLPEAKKLAERNVDLLGNIVTEKTPLIGLEPSAILSFRDEYPNIVDKRMHNAAQQLAQHVFTIEEFLFAEKELGNIISASFTKENRHVKVHGHCHQKALSSVDYSAFVLSLPENYHVDVIPSGCCGMAGSFGYEAEHYDVSMQIGELVLFSAVRKAKDDVIIAAPGTSCRHQIYDGTNKKALHPAEVLFDALVL